MLVVIIDIKSVRWLKSGTDKCMVSLPLSKVVRQYVVAYHEDAHVLLPNRLSVCRSIASSSSEVWDGVPAENRFQCFSSITECILLRCFKFDWMRIQSESCLVNDMPKYFKTIFYSENKGVPGAPLRPLGSAPADICSDMKLHRFLSV